MRKANYKDAVRTVRRAKEWPTNHPGYPLKANIRAAYAHLQGQSGKSEVKALREDEHADRVEMYRRDNGGHLPTLRDHDAKVRREMEVKYG